MAPSSERTWWLPWAGTAVLVLATFAAVIWATGSGATDGWLLNADEAVALLIPESFARGGAEVIFPGNSYQGLLEVPFYVLIEGVGGGVLGVRLLHHAAWIGAVVVWSVVGRQFLERSRGRLGGAARGWSLLAAVGLVGVTSLVGWQVWFHIYPGYQVGALLAGLAVLVGLRADRSGDPALWWWATAGVLGGLAIYAQPMHLVGAVCLAVLAVTSTGTGRSRLARVATAALGGLVGVAPWVIWNIRHGMPVLDPDARPVQHPDWGYADRLANTARLTVDVLWGDDRVRGQVPTWVVVAQLVGGIVLGVLAVMGLVALVRSWRRSAPLLVAVPLMLLGLPVLPTFSLDVDQRYAVAWWPALVVLVATGAASLGDVRAGAAEDGHDVVGPVGAIVRRRWVLVGRAVIAGAVVCHVAAVVGLARPAIASRSAQADAVELTTDLGRDLRRCGIDIVAGDYWAVYPAQWGSDGRFGVMVIDDMERLSGLTPRRWSGDRRVAVLSSNGGPPAASLAATVVARTGRAGGGWTPYQHRPTGVTVLLEADRALPDGCVASSGLTPVS